MDKTLRKELKTDELAVATEHALGYAASHRQQMIRYGGLAAAVLIIAGGAYWFFTSRAEERRAALREVYAAREATVGAEPQNGALKAFGTQQLKDAAVDKAISDLLAKHPGTEEAAIALFQKGTLLADKGNLTESRKTYEQLAAMGGDFGSLARFSIAQAMTTEGKVADAEKIFRELIAAPTSMVSKEQATMALARAIMATRPDEARKLVEPLRAHTRNQVSRNAVSLLGEIPAKK
ncbi:MAG: tetratricopeptide repeat protein [Bryobacteraceae bacterium]|nr:tetratricopeptide repeat protein [Bryobacteraceae bacterium]